MSRAVTEYLERKVASAPAATQTQWAALEHLYTRRLWHQLTLQLEDFVRHESLQDGQGLLELYENLIRDIEDRINPLSLVNIVLVVIQQIADPQDAVAFLGPVNDKVKHDHEATICIKTAIAGLRMSLNELDEVETVLDACDKELDSLDGVTPVHANYYKVAARFYQLKGDFAKFYVSALKYLGCIELDALQPAERVQLAFDLSLAALLGKNIYNFGELLVHPVLESLKSTAQTWLVDLLYAFNAGDISKFNELHAQWQSQDDLANSETELREKITLLALMEAVFRRPANKRDLSFQDIANETQVALVQVEVLVMRAMSLGLVRGSLDQVTAVASLNWVQPRVLDPQQLTNMRQRLKAWADTVQNTATAMSELTPELFVQQ